MLKAAHLVIGFATLSFACGGGPRRADVPSRSMPPNGTFTGVWNSPQYGEMHLQQTGTAVVGEYVKDERRGHLEGHALGATLRFEWNEQRETVRGRPTTTRGRGYFVYRIDAESTDHLIEGEWGHDRDEVGGGPWTAIRDRRRRQVGDTLHNSSGSEEPQGDSFDNPEGSSSAPTGGNSTTRTNLGDL